MRRAGERLRAAARRRRSRARSTGATGIRDLSLLGKLEVRGPAVGDLGRDVDVLQLTPSRALVVCEPERCAELRASLPGFVVDLSGALAGHRGRERRR